MQSFRQKLRGETPGVSNTEEDTRSRILKSALRLFARQGYDGTTTKDLAGAANISEGTLFRYFANKKTILVEVATAGWVDILTDLLTELSEMASYKAISQVMRRRMLKMHENNDLLRVCFIEAQCHPELNERIQLEVIVKMTDVAENRRSSLFRHVRDRRLFQTHDCRSPSLSRRSSGNGRRIVRYIS
jgi:AcrR family transcriptional regulator